MATWSRRSFLKASALALAAAATAERGARAATAAGSQRFMFLHTYEATGRYWEGIKKAGLLRPNTGVRLVNPPWGDDSVRFNHVARVGGPLHAILAETKPCFIVDRVVGGSPYNAYDFDKDLIQTYAEMLGDRLMGGQIHEVISNVHNDWKRFAKADPRFAKEPVDPDAVKDYFDWSGQARWLEYGVVEDYRGRTAPQSPQEYWQEIERAARRQGERFGSHFSYCEGSYWGELVWHLFYKLGASRCIAEVGPWASTDSAFAIASVRGAAKAAGKPWGIFHAPWGPDGCTSFVPIKDWSWKAPPESMEASSWPVGPDKGPSTALHRRMFFHAYLSGANTLHEEWGAEDNLVDWDAGTLSSYGQVTRDLLDFQAACPDVGEPFTPVALVLDSAAPPVAEPWAELKRELFARSEADKQFEAREGSGKAEAVCYSPCVLPEVFDIVPSDAPERFMASYKATIPVGGTEAAWPRLVEAVDSLCPFRRNSRMPMQVNFRASDGAWILGIYNPWGARRGDPFGVGSILDGGCAAADAIASNFKIASAQVLHAWPQGTTAKLVADKIEINVGPGGTLILEVKPAA